MYNFDLCIVYRIEENAKMKTYCFYVSMFATIVHPRFGIHRIYIKDMMETQKRIMEKYLRADGGIIQIEEDRKFMTLFQLPSSIYETFETSDRLNFLQFTTANTAMRGYHMETNFIF